MKKLLSNDGQQPEQMAIEISKDEENSRTPRPSKGAGGAKTARSETVTVRLDPKIRYLAELAGRKQRRTLSSFIEWAIENALTNVIINEHHNLTVSQDSENLWDVDEPDRFVRLALEYPSLLTYEEQKRWKLIRENGWLWKGDYTGANAEWRWSVENGTFDFLRLREKWEDFVSVANGTLDCSALPTWKKNDPILVKKPLDLSDMDDI